jgi:hypothetical protein
MNTSELESSRKKRKRSDSSASPERSRVRSRSRDKKKSKKEKRSKRSKSRRSKRRRSKSNRSGKRKNKRDRSRSRSPSGSEEKYNKYQPMPPMDPMMGQYLYYPPPMMAPRGDRMRPPMFYPPTFTGDYGVRPIRPPMSLPLIPPITKPIEVPTIEQPTDKIVKDQNFLNSDEKLFESIINNEMSIKTIFDDTQISQNYAGTTLYKTLKKALYDPGTAIFNGSKSQDVCNEPEKVILPKYNEKIKIAIDHIKENNCYDRLSIDMGDMSQIREKL